MNTKVNIFNESSAKKLPVSKLKQIVNNCLEKENSTFTTVNVIFMSDKDIQKINNEYLQHNYATDVISFNLEGENEEQKIGEIYISVETAALQAEEFKVSLTNELLRLAAHGTLHLCGYEDSNDALKQEMHQKENELLNNLKTNI